MVAARDVNGIGRSFMSGSHGGLENGRLATLLILFFGRTESYVLRMAIPPLIPILMEQFEWNSYQVGLLASAYLWTYAFAQVPWGAAVDRWGGKKSLTLGWLITLIGSLAFAMGTNLEQLVLSRLLFGVGAASILVASTVMVSEIYSRQERGRAMGVISASSSVGTLLAGLIIPWLFATSLQLPNLDVWRSVAVVVTLPAILAAFSLSKTHGISRTKPNGSTTIVETPPTFSKRSLLKDSRLYLMSAALIGYVAGSDIPATWIYVYLQQEYRLSGTLAGSIGSLSLFVPAIISPLLSGWLSDHFGVRARVAAIGAVFASASVTLLAFRLPLHITVLALIVYGTFTLFLTPIFSMPAEVWSIEVAGTALSIAVGFSQVAAAILPIASGYLLTRTGNFGVIWLLGSCIYLVAAIALLLIPEKKSQIRARQS